MERAGRLLDEVLVAGAAQDAGRELTRLRGRWGALVGEALSRSSYARDVDEGVLRVEALHSSAIQMLQLQSRELCRRLRAEFPLLAVERVRTVLVRELPGQELGASPLPKIVLSDGNSEIQRSKPGKFQALLRKLREDSETDATD